MNQFDAAKDLVYFIDFKLKHPDVFKDFIRNMLNDKSKNASSTLEYIRSLMPAEELTNIVGAMSDSDRLIWKTNVGKEKAISDPFTLMIYVRGEMLKAFIAARPLVDPDLMELTLKLKVNDVVKFGNLYPSNTGELLGLLNPSFISKVLDKLDVSGAQKFLEAALDVAPRGEIESDLKKNLKKFLEVSSKNSMSSKLIKVLEGVDPSKERMIYKHMLTATSTDDLIDTAMRNCPLEVVWLLPKSALNDVLVAYPLAKKAKLLVSLVADKQKILLDASSSEGSSARQMIEMEIKQIEDNPQELRRCQVSSGSLSLEFLKFLRQHGVNNEQILSDIRMSCQVWFNQLTENPKSEIKAA